MRKTQQVHDRKVIHLRIELKNVSFTYSRGTPFENRVFENLNLSFDSDRFYALIGKNGAGKTTLLQILALLLRPTDGEILFDGEDPWRNPRSFRRRIGFAFQFPENQFFCETVEEEIGYAPKNFGLEGVEVRIERALKMLDLDRSILRRSPFTLSGGEKRKVAIASIISHDPDILILDEPLVSLDWRSRWEILEFFKNWKTSKKSLVISTHHLDVLSSVIDEVIDVEKLTRLKLNPPFP